MSRLFLECHVVEENPEYNYNRTEAWEKANLVAKYDYRGPDEEGSLARVGHAVCDRADVVHEDVGRDGLKVEEDAVEDEAGEHAVVGERHLVPVHEEEAGGDGDNEAGRAGVELELGRRVLQVLARDKHLGVDVLAALADVSEEGGREAGQVVAQLVGGAQRQPEHDRDQAQLNVVARSLSWTRKWQGLSKCKDRLYLDTISIKNNINKHQTNVLSKLALPAIVVIWNQEAKRIDINLRLTTGNFNLEIDGSGKQASGKENKPSINEEEKGKVLQIRYKSDLVLIYSSL